MNTRPTTRTNLQRERHGRDLLTPQPAWLAQRLRYGTSQLGDQWDEWDPMENSGDMDDDRDSWSYVDYDYTFTDTLRFSVIAFLRGRFQPRIMQLNPLSLLGSNASIGASPVISEPTDSWSLERAVQYLATLDEARYIWPIPYQVDAGILALATHPFFSNLQRHSSDVGIQCLMMQLVVLHPFWLRPITSWRPTQEDPEQNLKHLLNHLLIRYPVPRWLEPATSLLPTDVFWHFDRGGYPTNEPGEGLRSLLPLVAAGRGWSLSEALRQTWPVRVMLPANSALMRHSLTAPAGLSLRQLRHWLVIHALGGDRCLYERLMDLVHLTETDLVKSLVPWMQEHRGEIPEAWVAAIAEWALHEFTEMDSVRTQQGSSVRAFSMKGRSPARVIQAVTEYHQLLNASSTRHWTWPKRGWDWEALVAGQKWTIRELASGAELQAESAAMHHCVATYAQNCMQGVSAIFSLAAEGQRKLTLEYRPEAGQLVQVRGWANRLPTPAEEAVVQLWTIAKLPRADAPAAGTGDKGIVGEEQRLA